jgi:acetyl-CoA carboxylase biotin carboxyl carrier protein
MELSIEDVREIVAAYLASEVDNLTLDTPGFSIALSRSATTSVVAARREAPAPGGGAAAAVPPQVAASAPSASTPAPAATPSAGIDTTGTIAVVAPTVGVFYRRPAPNEAPYVEVGDTVDAGSTVCIIDVMKLFNKVPAGVAGRIVEICVNDGELVEHGQVIMRIAP